MISIRETINQAIKSEVLIWIRYRDFYGRVTEREIQPLEWTDNDTIKSYCHLRSAERNFKIHNIIECRVLDVDTTRIVNNDKSDVHDYINYDSACEDMMSITMSRTQWEVLLIFLIKLTPYVEEGWLIDWIDQLRSKLELQLNK